MTGRELVRKFKAANWAGPQEVQEFVAAAALGDAGDVSKLLDVLGNRSLSSDRRAHQLRCTVFQQLVEKRGTKAFFRPMVKSLKDLDSGTRKLVVGLIPKVNSVAEHGELCNLLRNKDQSLRRIAGHLLEQLGGKTALNTIDSMIREPSFLGRLEAIGVVCRVAGHYAIPTLAEVLRVGLAPEKAAALKALGDVRFVSKDIGGALKVIATQLVERDEVVIGQAIISYSALCSEEQYFEQIAYFLDQDNLRLVSAALQGLRRFQSPRAVAILERKLRVGPNSIRMAVLDVLEGIGNDTILPALIQALGHRQLAVRKRAGEVLAALSRSGQLDIARTIVWLLRSPDVELRRMAAELANAIRDPDAELWPKLVTCLRDEDWWVRERVLDALIGLGGQDLARHMVAYLQDPSDVIRRFGVDVLMRLKDPRSVGALVRVAMADQDWWVREKAVEAVAEMGDARVVPHIVHILGASDEMALICIQALEKMKARDTAAHVAAKLTSEDRDIRWVALCALQAFDARDQAEAVRPLIQDPDVKVRKLARDLLLRWQVPMDQADLEVAEGMLSPLDRLLVAMAAQEGDDLVLAVDRMPYVKRMGRMLPLSQAVLTEGQINALVQPLLSTVQVEELGQLRDVDFSHEVAAKNLRFRVNVFAQRTGLCAVFRIVKGELPELDLLGLPPRALTLSELKNGLILVGGPTGSGKSTTLAALINRINETTARHIISIEDPIEVSHGPKKSLVNQREIGSHTHSYANALRSTLRQDPDVILIGELRDLPTISFAVSAAETGHLVFGTVHTVSAETTMDRLTNAFPPAQQDQVRTMLAESLQAVLCQYLLKRKDKPGRCLAAELMVNTDAVANLIRKGNAYQIPSVIATSREQGMQLMDMDLMRLLKEGKIDAEEAYMKATNKKEFEEFVEGGVTPGEPQESTQPGAPALTGRAATPPGATVLGAPTPGGETPPMPGGSNPGRR